MAAMKSAVDVKWNMADIHAEHERKVLDTFQVPMPAPHSSKPAHEIIIPRGNGTSLGEIPIINSYISKLPSDHDLLRALHHLLYKSFGKKSKRKKSLRAFCGFDDYSSRTSVVNSLSGNKRWTTATISNLADLLDIIVTGKSKSEMIEIVADFLQSPAPSGRLPSKRKVLNSALDPNKRSRKRRGPKRPLTAYFLYVKEVRPVVIQKHPEVPVTQIASLIGAKWRALEESERASYKERAKKALEQYKIHMAQLEQSGALDSPPSVPPGPPPGPPVPPPAPAVD